MKSAAKKTWAYGHDPSFQISAELHKGGGSRMVAVGTPREFTAVFSGLSTVPGPEEILSTSLLNFIELNGELSESRDAGGIG